MKKGLLVLAVFVLAALMVPMQSHDIGGVGVAADIKPWEHVDTVRTAEHGDTGGVGVAERGDIGGIGLAEHGDVGGLRMAERGNVGGIGTAEHGDVGGLAA